MKIYNFKSFLSEAIVVTEDIQNNLIKVKSTLSPEESEWVDIMLKNIGKDIPQRKLKFDDDYELSTSDKEDYFNINNLTKGKSPQLLKVGKALKLLAPDIPNHILANIASAMSKSEKFDIKEVSGKSIADFYKYNKIVDKSTLGNSCMNDKPRMYFEIYVENQEVVKLIVLLDEEENLQARALVWKTNHGWVMDRIYYSHEKFLHMIKEHAIKNNYLMNISIYDDKEYYIQLKESDFEYFPYLDTFNFLCINKKILSNDDTFDHDDQVISLRGTSGDYEVVRNVVVEFTPLNSIDVYKYVSDIVEFINLSINYDKWYDSFISSEVQNYVDDFEEFLDSYGFHINKNIEKIQEIDNVITIDNYQKVLLDLYDRYPSKIEDVVRIVIEDRYNKKDYPQWKDIFEEIYGGLSRMVWVDIKNIHFKNHFTKLIEGYCDINTFNKNFKKLYEEDYPTYLELLEMFT